MPRPIDVTSAPRALRTRRLALEAPRLEHAAAFLDSVDASIATLRFIGWGQDERDLGWAEAFCRRGAGFVERGECVIFNVFRLDDRAYVGRIDLHSFDWDAPRCEIGYVGDVRFSGRGLMREAALAVVQLAFALGFARVHALCDVRNPRSARFAEALGFVREGVLRRFERDTAGELADMVMLAAYEPPAV